MYEHNFAEPQLQHLANKISTNYNKLSRKGRKFLDLMDQNVVKVNKHYELSLPLKEKYTLLHNNKGCCSETLSVFEKKVR